ncbi:hypothetical protein [Alloactinosynnema sp. L-07]|nr:hypothetical protein [Alloactinosynnema sp. L-07]
MRGSADLNSCVGTAYRRVRARRRLTPGGRGRHLLAGHGPQVGMVRPRP